MALELVITCSDPGDRTRPWVSAMLWTWDEDPKLVASMQFAAGADLRVWLKARVAEHAPEVIGVRWTDSLLANRTLAQLVAVCLDIEMPDKSTTRRVKRTARHR